MPNARWAVTALDWWALALAFVDGAIIGYVAGGRLGVIRHTFQGATMGDERETTAVIRRLRDLPTEMGPNDDSVQAYALRMGRIGAELLELARRLESIDARYERLERVQPGDGPRADPPLHGVRAEADRLDENNVSPGGYWRRLEPLEELEAPLPDPPAPRVRPPRRPGGRPSTKPRAALESVREVLDRGPVDRAPLEQDPGDEDA